MIQRLKNAMQLKHALLAALLVLPALPAMSAPSSEPSVQVGFSPEGTALQLVLEAINSSQQSIHMMAYSFTDPDVMKALIAAKKRGVDVKIVIDEDGNKNGASKHAMNLMAQNNIPLRIDGAYKIQHDKVMVIDGVSVETGSYNFSRAAARSNSENAVVIWNMPQLAKAYLDHWQIRWDKGQDYQVSY